jgi:putative flippase GtrA
MMSLLRFLTVGALATGMHVAAFAVLVELVAMPPVKASAAAFALATLLAYLLNRVWSFASTGRHLIQLPRYLGVALSGLALNVAIMHVAVNGLHLDYWIGLSAVIVALPAFTFTLHRYWTFAATASA